MRQCAALVRQGQGISWWSIVMEQVEASASKVFYLIAWNLGRNTSLAIPGRAISKLLNRVATQFYLWVRTLWPERQMECSATRSHRRPGTTRGSMIRWWAKAVFWLQSLAAGM